MIGIGFIRQPDLGISTGFNREQLKISRKHQGILSSALTRKSFWTPSNNEPLIS